MQRLRHLVGGLVVVHHALEPADRGGVHFLTFVPAADFHLTAGNMVAAQVDLQPRVAGIGGAGEAVHHLLQRRHRLLRALLVARDVDDLLVIAERAQVVGIADVATRRMQLDVVVQRGQRLGVVVLQVLTVARHELGVRRPGRERIVLLHQVELVDCRGVALVVQRIDAVVVEGLDRQLRRPCVVGVGLVLGAAAAEQRQQQHRAEREAAEGAARRGEIGHGAGGRGGKDRCHRRRL